MLLGCSSSRQTTTLSPRRQSNAAPMMFRPSDTFLVMAISAGRALIRPAKRSRARSTVANIADLSAAPISTLSSDAVIAVCADRGSRPRAAVSR